jgi:hypothetical protein
MTFVRRLLKYYNAKYDESGFIGKKGVLEVHLSVAHLSSIVDMLYHKKKIKLQCAIKRIE